MAGQPAARSDRVAELLARYRPPAGVSDELIDGSGAIRPVWRPFIDHLAGLSGDEIAHRLARGDRYLQDAGVYYRQYGEAGAAERDWPLSHVPVLIDEAEWQTIVTGIRQRATLLESVVADLYSANRLVADGHLPASLVARNPEWLRPMVGVRPRSGHFLHFLAFEIGRGPDGGWWVLGDRTQAPSGAGFALENRIATSRAFSELFPQVNVHRLAGFFRAFRDALQRMRGEDDAPVGILTPGPLNDTYFEHAYIARYLGFSLLEGEDLTVRDGRVMVRTVSGLQPVSVLWRRLDAAWADPLELFEGSRIGTPGLVGALRRNGPTMVNALGAGVLEMRALLAFLPRICEALRGEPLALPNLATWWCGQTSEREHVKAHTERMTIGQALATQLPFRVDDKAVVGGQPVGDIGVPVAEWIDAAGPDLVGQEAVTLSTTPALIDGALVPRPMILRVFAARTPEGWTIMPGGFARIGHSGDPAAVAMQAGGSVADVWVTSERRVAEETMLTDGESLPARNRVGALPSRAADNLYWLGRYVERAEGFFRLLRAYHARLAETAGSETPLLVQMRTYLRNAGVDPDDGMPEGLVTTLSSAVGSAGRVRDRFSVDGWTALSELARNARGQIGAVTPGDDAARAMGVLLRGISGFSGLVHENMYRFLGWRFMSIGRALERALSMTTLLSVFADPDAPDGGLDLVVEVGDSVMAQRRRHSVSTTRATVIDLMALDALNPRSVLYQLGELQEHVNTLPGASSDGRMSTLTGAVLQTHSMLAVATPTTLDRAALYRLGDGIAGLSNQLAAAYLK
ncbi:circularly permuted type 2 ATP-grasp protein [Algiphilus sp.]|uniref:circularly permuted type 2 ATP-grasp protein n=1 Tax=Algiphilus sp. TaxID=1872431 RepID=UPI003C6A4D3E